LIPFSRIHFFISFSLSKRVYFFLSVPAMLLRDAFSWTSKSAKALVLLRTFKFFQLAKSAAQEV
jgi:hypothetical protein